MTTTRKATTLTASKLLASIRPGQTCTAQALARQHATSAACVISLLNDLIRSGDLTMGPASARTMRVHRPSFDAGQPVVRTIPTPDNGVFRGTLTGYSEAHAQRAELCMLVRRS
ncbi:hypothetical protein [Burkholderia pseudomallei]|uniref:hypothetical protein n=1 Tax=Burkholderia pseudomallei TaxID=28450 RepID=UPI0012B95D3F|nr:hypothetical protein [Burkholderia pseudomallei]